jgi:DEAD/DEAH box helicase domain-containing protein
LVVYEPGSIVSVRIAGTLIERELLEPKLFTFGDTTMLMYRYKNRDDGESWVPHDQVEPTGQDWKHVIWNPETGTYIDPESLSADSF